MYHIREGNFPFKEYIISYKKRKFSFQEVDKNWVITRSLAGLISEYVVLYIVEGVTYRQTILTSTSCTLFFKLYIQYSYTFEKDKVMMMRQFYKAPVSLNLPIISTNFFV